MFGFNLLKCNRFRRKQAGKKPVVVGASIVGWGRGGRGRGEECHRCERLACAREHTCQCTQVGARPMLVADAGKKCLESTMSIPANMSLLEESL